MTQGSSSHDIIDTPQSDDNLPASPVACENPNRSSTPEHINLNGTGSDDTEHGDDSEQQHDREENIEPEADLGSLDQINDNSDTAQRAALNPIRPASPAVNEDETSEIPHVEELRTSLAFIEALKRASLDDGDLDEDLLYRLRHPPQEPLDASDPDLRLSLDLFLSTLNASEDSYRSAAEGIRRRHPDDEILSYEGIRKKVAEMSGVHPIIHHMCINSCVAFTGPYSDLDKCPLCAESRYEKRRIDTTSINQSAPQRGGARKSQNINVTMQYAEDADGVPVDGDRAGAMRRHARAIWDHFATKGIPVKTWTKTDSLNQQYYYTDMCRQFPELRLCDLNWKADKIAVDTYSSWYSNRRPATSFTIKNEPNSADKHSLVKRAGTPSLLASQSKKLNPSTTAITQPSISPTHSPSPQSLPQPTSPHGHQTNSDELQQALQDAELVISKQK